jgi:hypothetical protein
MKCRRCAGPMFPDEEGERFCLMCGERTYDWIAGFLDRLLEAMERQALKESRAQYPKSRECTTQPWLIDDDASAAAKQHSHRAE